MSGIFFAALAVAQKADKAKAERQFLQSLDWTPAQLRAYQGRVANVEFMANWVAAGKPRFCGEAAE